SGHGRVRQEPRRPRAHRTHHRSGTPPVRGSSVLVSDRVWLAHPLHTREAMAKSASIEEPASAAALIPARAPLAKLRKIAAGCTACDLYKRGTQTVFGEGGARARVVFVGEQPGHEEDLAGRPFVGP